MKAPELISPERLQSATASLVDDSTFAERVAWWLRGAHASERWFQFEWAYRFQQEMPPEWSVLCEVQNVDVVIRELGMHSGPPVAGVEIKWYGNWWVDDLGKVEEDIGKADGYDFPAAAALFFLDVTTTSDAVGLSWLPDQVPRLGISEPPNVAVVSG